MKHYTLGYTVYYLYHYASVFPLHSWNYYCWLVIVIDLAASENSIPLSPQWLYAKPTETKMVSVVSWEKVYIFYIYIFHKASCFV